VKLVLGTFACSGIKALLGVDTAAGVQAALRHYTQTRGSAERRAEAFPRFLDESSMALSGADLELTVDPEIQAALEREARESDGVSVEQIAAHAVLLYLAELDVASGRGEALLR
jgi:hypothetical protein